MTVRQTDGQTDGFSALYSKSHLACIGKGKGNLDVPLIQAYTHDENFNNLSVKRTGQTTVSLGSLRN